MKLLLIEDEPELAKSIQKYLNGNEFICEWVDRFSAAIDKISVYEYDTILLDLMLPETPDTVKIGYTQKQLAWCRDNEKNIWAFLIDNELLYASGAETMRKFFTDGPFTHEFSRQAPARIGEWTGWQIVRSYMLKNPTVTPAQLFADDDAQSILIKSGYRP
jgi:CheY-like chemotaxis protein